MSNTSIGRGPVSGGNENHDGDPRHTTMGEAVQQERPAGNEVLEEANAAVPVAIPAGQAQPDAKAESLKPPP